MQTLKYLFLLFVFFSVLACRNQEAEQKMPDSLVRKQKVTERSSPEVQREVPGYYIMPQDNSKSQPFMLILPSPMMNYCRPDEELRKDSIPQKE